MRNDARAPRAAGNRLTGTLTRPNVNVPDQNGLPPALSSSAAGCCLRAVRAISSCASSSAFVLLQSRNALREHIVERGGLSFRLHRLQTRRVTLRFLLNELHHALAILVLVILRVELAFQHVDELRGHR